MPGTIFSRQTMKNRDWKEARSQTRGNHTVRPGHVREQARHHGAREGRADRQRREIRAFRRTEGVPVRPLRAEPDRQGRQARAQGAGLEDRALELGHPEFELACFRGGSALVMAGAERLAVIGALVSGSSGDLVRFRGGHRVEDPGYFLGAEPVEFGFEQVLIDLYDGVVGHG